MGKNNLISLLSIILVLLITTLSCEDTIEPKKNYIKYCKDGAVFFVNDEYKVQNNVWGFISSPSSPKFTQCVFHDSTNPSIIGWEWEINTASEYPSYPRVEYGWNPWCKESTTQNLPRKLSSLSSVVISFKKMFSAEGTYNTAFDIWITKSETSNVENLKAEIMIWLDCTKVPGTDLTVGNLTINHETYDFYKNTTWNTIPYIAFVKKNNTWNEQLDILPILSYLVENNHISSSDYLVDIEFGNEIWTGKGFMELTDYHITIK